MQNQSGFGKVIMSANTISFVLVLLASPILSLVLKFRAPYLCSTRFRFFGNGVWDRIYGLFRKSEGHKVFVVIALMIVVFTILLMLFQALFVYTFYGHWFK